jgi:hypothetical protein
MDIPSYIPYHIIMLYFSISKTSLAHMCTKSDVSNIDFVFVLDSFNNNDLDIG